MYLTTQSIKRVLDPDLEIVPSCVNLDAVQPDEEPNYLLDGDLLALHRKARTGSPFSALGARLKCGSRHAEPLMPGGAAVLTRALLPIVARIPAGHCLRVVHTGGYVPEFAKVPAHGKPPFLKIYRDLAGRYVDLPIIELQAESGM